jgi:hypothetical protein
VGCFNTPQHASTRLNLVDIFMVAKGSHPVQTARMTSSNKPPEGKPGQPQLQIQLPPETALGAYVNLTLVNHTETEFVFDFIFIQPLEPRATVRSRIISSPKHAKRLLQALQENIARYEERWGVVDVDNSKPVH